MEELYYEGNCDVCMKPDNSHEHNLQRCKQCQVLVHELCYGMPPTTTKDKNFICHACKAINTTIEVNGISHIGGMNFKDLILSKDGRISLKEFITKQQQDAAGKSDDNDVAEKQMRKVNHSTYLVNVKCEKLLNFYIAITDFCLDSSKDDDDDDDDDTDVKKQPSLEDELFKLLPKEQAQQIFDRYCAKDAEHKVDLPSTILSKIDDTIYNNEHDITSTLFDAAKKYIYKELEQTTDLFTRYRQSIFYPKFLASQRSIMKQDGRPSECALCSVSTGLHAMHPLYDTHGKEGRQYVIPSSGTGILKKDKRLAWCHTLCGMSLCTKGYVYGCDSNGEYEMPSDDEDGEDKKEQVKKNNKVIGGDDSEDEDDDDNLEDEQIKFTNCEAIFNPLREQLEGVGVNADSVALVLRCIDSMMEYVKVLTPLYIAADYPILGGNLVQLIKMVKRNLENCPEVKAKCKQLLKEMKRIYNNRSVPEQFVPVRMDNEDSDDTSNQRVETGTSLSKSFHDKNFNGIVTEYNEGSEKPYRVVYTDGKYEDMTESEVSDLINSKFLSTAFFCINEGMHYLESLSEEEEASDDIKDLRELQCVICRKTSKSTIKIPVQCSAGDDTEYEEFREFHVQLNNKRKLAKKLKGTKVQGTKCTQAMHVGCARWGAAEKYVKNSTNNKSLRRCYYFPGRSPTYVVGEETFDEPVSNCFCCIHAKEIMDGLSQDNDRKRKGSDIDDDDDDLIDDNDGHESDNAEKDKKIAADIKDRKRKRVMEESDESD